MPKITLSALARDKHCAQLRSGPAERDVHSQVEEKSALFGSDTVLRGAG